VSVTARAVSSTGTMPVHAELVEDMLLLVISIRPFQRLRALMSPCMVLAWMSSAVVPSFLRELLTRP
jgi:hypothetical protein